MTRFKISVAVCLLALGLFAGCKKDSGSEGGEGEEAVDCPTGKMTVNGEEIAFQTAFGYGERGEFSLELYNHEVLDCEIILARAARTVPEGEIDLRLATSFGGIVASGSQHQGGVTLTLVSEPSEAGDTIAYCIPEEVTIAEGVVVVGLFSGEFCGFVE
jgi:hypothetical protein